MRPFLLLRPARQLLQPQISYHVLIPIHQVPRRAKSTTPNPPSPPPPKSQETESPAASSTPEPSPKDATEKHAAADALPSTPTQEPEPTATSSQAKEPPASSSSPGPSSKATTETAASDASLSTPQRQESSAAPSQEKAPPATSSAPSKPNPEPTIETAVSDVSPPTPSHGTGLAASSASSEPSPQSTTAKAAFEVPASETTEWSPGTKEEIALADAKWKKQVRDRFWNRLNDPIPHLKSEDFDNQYIGHVPREFQPTNSVQEGGIAVSYDMAREQRIRQSLAARKRDGDKEEKKSNYNLRYPRAVQALYLKPLRRVPEDGVPSADLQLRSYSVRNLEFFADFALRAAYYLELPAFGAHPLPKITERWTVPKSHFIFKKRQENFERVTHRRLIQIKDGHPESVKLWLAFLRKHQYHGVGMKANVWEWSALDVASEMDSAAEAKGLDAAWGHLGDSKTKKTANKVAELLQRQRFKLAGGR
ncbi:hypothetical protein MKZ38_006036 [Zalerion maritima]|uniref:Small ribosomal subunit protein uS10m n=1 Tax=Zalerion maritima TaxID=339359 RepID=A0AAD5RJM1_9PEZI|nr:hypothetical protein MKZ38_006036 [Zalerion maritima]